MNKSIQREGYEINNTSDKCSICLSHFASPTSMMMIYIDSGDEDFWNAISLCRDCLSCAMRDIDILNNKGPHKLHLVQDEVTTRLNQDQNS